MNVFVILIFFCLGLIGFIQVLKPEWTVAWTIKYFQWSLKLLGFESEIRSTEKAKSIVRIWNCFYLLMLVVMVTILSFLK